MCLVTWRVYGSDFDVDGFLRRFPALGGCDVWRKGEKAPGRKLYERSGFSLTIFEGASSAGAMAAIRQALDELSDVRAVLGELRVRSELRVGLFVGGQDGFIATFPFSVEDMRLLSDAGVGVEVVGYPTSDD